MNLVGNVNKSAAAAFFRVTTQSLDRWFIAGCPIAKRGSNGSILELDLAEMTQWRVERARERKDPEEARKPSPPGAVINADGYKRFASEFLVPALANDFRADIERIAALAEVTVDQAICVWSSWIVLNYETLHRMFDDEDLAIRHTEFTIAELKKSASIIRLVKRGKKAMKLTNNAERKNGIRS